jgi:MFS family permease
VSILYNRSFRRLWLASLFSLTGSQISRIGLILYVSETGDSVANLAFLMVFETLPGALAAPLAGVVVDRLSKRSVMISSDLLRVLLMLAILLHPTLSIIYFVAALHSIATVFFQPAKLASIPLIVEEEQLVRANGIDQSASNLTLILGPVIGAALFVRFGLAATLVVDSLTFLMSALLVAVTQVRQAERASKGLSVVTAIKEVREGWSYLAQHRLALHLNLLLFTALLCTGLWMPLAPFFIRDYLGGSTMMLGWQIGIFGLGAALGGLLAPRLTKRFGTGIILFLGFLAEGAMLSIYGLVSRAGASLLLIFVWGSVVSLAVVPFYSILQKVVEERFQGRVFSVVKQSENLAVVLAMVAAMLLHDVFKSQLIFLFAGLFYFGFVALSSSSKGGRMLLATR